MFNNTVNLLHSVRTAALLILILLAGPATSHAQALPGPERETLLNGLRILYWPQPANPKVVLRLRIHSGAAFDLADKAGMMALLGDALFPDPATREYVTEELEGRLEVTTSLDWLDVTISGKASELERMIDLLRGAFLTTQLGAENVATLRNARLKLLSEKPATAAEVADAAIAARLFGVFPYGRPASGTVASVTKLDRADLLLSRERFLNADNASLAVIGGVQKTRLMRALRQLLGPWAKAEKSIPSTFRQPAPPDSRILALDQAGATNTEIRIAVRGLSRGDNDTLAANLLAYIIRDRWQAALSDLAAVSARHESHVLPGMFVLSASVPTASASKAVSAAQDVMRALVQNGPSASELERARLLLQTEISGQTSQTEGAAELWLDMDTFNSPRPDTIPTLVRSLTASDVQRVAGRLFRDAAVATVVVGNYDQLKAAFAGRIESSTDVPKITRPALPIIKP
jgi:predicted Zn-dependent peptidase